MICILIRRLSVLTCLSVVLATFLECYLQLECLGKVAKDNLCQITYQLLPSLKNHLLLKVEANPLYENLKV